MTQGSPTPLRESVPDHDRRARSPVGASQADRAGGSFRREDLAVYAHPHLGRSLLEIATSVIPYLALSVAMYLALPVSYLLVLLIAIPAAGFLVRTFILFHDCSHGSLLPSRRANAWLGIVLGLLVYSPFMRWRHDHAVHHATSGDLDRRGAGDVRTLTVASTTRGAALAARLQAVPQPADHVRTRAGRGAADRTTHGLARARPRMRRSVIGTNIALALLVAALCWLIGWSAFLLVQLPTVLLAGSAGIWLFYVQHQFEDAYWEDSGNWSYADAALRGSSYLKLPRVLQFFSGNIGLHHVHHLNARIPNYNLQRAHDENPIFHAVPTLSFTDGLRSVRLKLWDEDRRRLVTFAQARSSAAGTSR